MAARDNEGRMCNGTILWVTEKPLVSLRHYGDTVHCPGRRVEDPSSPRRVVSTHTSNLLSLFHTTSSKAFTDMSSSASSNKGSTPSVHLTYSSVTRATANEVIAAVRCEARSP
jgi:hypothetical protein